MRCKHLDRVPAATGVLFAVAAYSCTPSRTIDVTTTSDGGNGSLRAAIDAANREHRRDVVIKLPSGTYSLTRCGADDSNRAGDLDITRERAIAIEAVGQNVVIRQTCPAERVIDDLGQGALTLTGVTVTGGALAPADSGEPARGGGVRAAGNVQLIRTVITANSATGSPGAASEAGETSLPGGVALGGGLFVGGSLQAVDSTFSANTAAGGLGGAADEAGRIPSAGGGSEGGGAYVLGAITTTGGAVVNNRAAGGQGGDADALDRRTPSGNGGAARGAGLAQASSSSAAFAATRTSFTDNLAAGGGAGKSTLSVDANTPLDPVSGSTAQAGSATGGALASAGPLTLQNITALRNGATGGSTSDCPTCRAGASLGGAVATAGTASLTASTLSENQCTGGSAVACQCWLGICCTGPVCDAYFRALVCNGCVTDYCRFTFGCWGGPSPVPPLSEVDLCVSQLSAPITGGSAIWADQTVELNGGVYSRNTLTIGGPTSQNSSGYDGAVVVKNADLRATDAILEGNIGTGLMSEGTVSAVNTSLKENGEGINGVNVELDRVRIDSNQGWGIRSVGAVTLVDTAIIGNSSSDTTGGVWARTLQADRTTIANNNGTPIQADTAALRNTTVTAFSGSDANPSSFIVNVGSALELDHATLSGVLLVTPQLTTARSVAIAATDRSVCPVPSDASSRVTVASTGYNWFSDTSCGLDGPADRQEDAAFLLGALADNGGPVPTLLPGNESVLIDHVPIGACSITRDARGVTRPQGAACDIGAVEVEVQITNR